VLPTLVIGLREGLEASLIVGIVAAFLGQRGDRRALRAMWAGVVLAVLLCAGVGVALKVAEQQLRTRDQEALETVVATVAIVMVTSMIIWMRANARNLKRDLERSAASALDRGSSIGLVLMAFLAVFREGFETTVFLLAVLQNGAAARTGTLGAVIGVAIAIVIGYGIYRGGRRVDLGRFFTITGAVLVLVAAGLVMSALGTANEAGWISSGQHPLLDLTWLVRPGTPVFSLFNGVLGVPARPVTLQVIGWIAYFVPMIVFVTWPRRRHHDGRGRR
jgi:high-affinity iron transporter